MTPMASKKMVQVVLCLLRVNQSRMLIPLQIMGRKALEALEASVTSD